MLGRLRTSNFTGRNTFLEETYPFEVSADDEGQGGSLENKESIEEPSTPSTEDVEELGALDEDVAGSVDGSTGDQHEPATPMYRCSVHGCSEVAIVHSEDVEEEERTYGSGDGGVHESHLSMHFKRLSGLTPKQAHKERKNLVNWRKNMGACFTRFMLE